MRCRMAVEMMKSSHVEKARKELGDVSSVEKVQQQNVKSAYCVGHRYCAPLEEQIAAARAWGIPEKHGPMGEVSPVFVDDVRKVKANNWEPRLRSRRTFMAYFDGFNWDDETVFLHSYLCAGWVPRLAKEFVETIHGARAHIYVHQVERTFGPDDDMTEFWEAHRKALKAVEMREYRKRNK